MKNKISSVILCLVMLISLLGRIGGIMMVEAAGIDVNNYCTDIFEFRTGEKETWTYPSKEGYVFAGWYSDDHVKKSMHCQKVQLVAEHMRSLWMKLYLV